MRFMTSGFCLCCELSASVVRFFDLERGITLNPFLVSLLILLGVAVRLVVETLGYKSEGTGCDSVVHSYLALFWRQISIFCGNARGSCSHIAFRSLALGYKEDCVCC